MSYVFDTSALIGAWVRSYPPDIFPGMWDEMEALCEASRLLIPEEVLEKLRAQDDDLFAWVKGRAKTVVAPLSRDLMMEVRSVLTDHPLLTKTGTGRGKADPFVIALASLRGLPVVTQEQGGSANKPRIPFACSQRGVPCMTVLDVMSDEGWRF